MATKRRTDHDSQRQGRRQESPAVAAAPADQPAPGSGTEKTAAGSVSRDQAEQAARATETRTAEGKAAEGKAGEAKPAAKKPAGKFDDMEDDIPF